MYKRGKIRLKALFGLILLILITMTEKDPINLASQRLKNYHLTGQLLKLLDGVSSKIQKKHD